MTGLFPFEYRPELCNPLAGCSCMLNYHRQVSCKKALLGTEGGRWKRYHFKVDVLRTRGWCARVRSLLRLPARSLKFPGCTTHLLWQGVQGKVGTQFELSASEVLHQSAQLDLQHEECWVQRICKIKVYFKVLRYILS